MKETLIKVIEEHKALCFQDTSMALELICEALYYKYDIDATYKGRSIYVNNNRVASVEVSKEGYKCVAIFSYKVL